MLSTPDGSVQLDGHVAGLTRRSPQRCVPRNKPRPTAGALLQSPGHAAQCHKSHPQTQQDQGYNMGQELV
jgi:hypothetical protein